MFALMNWDGGTIELHEGRAPLLTFGRIVVIQHIVKASRFEFFGLVCTMFRMVDNNTTPFSRALSAAMQAKVPVVITGQPGVGKTSMVRSMAEAMAVPFVHVALGGIPLEYLRGTPVAVDRDGAPSVGRAAPEWLVTLQAAGNGVLLLDDVGHRPADVDPALLSIVKHRRIGDNPLPADAVVLLAGSTTAGASGASLGLPAAVANCCMHLEYSGLTPEEFGRGILTGFDAVIPDLDVSNPADANIGARQVGAFLQQHPDVLNDCPDGVAEQSGAWPSETSWENLSRALPFLSDDDPDVRSLVSRGLVGDRWGADFIAWIDDGDLVDQ